MADLLLELFCEEIPARMQRKAAGDLKKLVTDKLVDAGLTYEAAREYWTPCRLTLDLRGLTPKSNDVEEERKGPSVKAPEAAIAGFLRASGLKDIQQADIASDPKKGDYYIARTLKPGRTAQDIIADTMPEVIRTFPWPKSMRWGAASARAGALRWIRPLHSILCLLSTETDSQVVDFEIGGIRAGDTTCGHHFMSDRQPITVRRFEDYAARLEEAHVILDAERRKEIILADARNLCCAQGLDLVEDEELAEEVVGLVEWPVVLTGEFEEEFLQIPPEIIRLTIRTNQKCFVTRKRGEDTALSNRFILVANIEAADGGKEIIAGNGKVVRARLSDALYFWHTDQADLPDVKRLKSSAGRLGLDLKKPLDQRMARLDHLNVTFHARLGTQGARVARIAALAEKIAPLVEAKVKQVRRAASLAKADLQTEIVGEFPELQGLTGYKYALLQGEDEAVAQAIAEHYKPQGPTDSVPRHAVSVAVALADKIDTLVGFWMIDEKPTGSKDPYALRRAALGVIRLVLSQDWTIHLLPLFREAVQLLTRHIVERNLAVFEQNMRADSARDTDGAQDIAIALSAEEKLSTAALLDKAEPVLQDLLGFFHERFKVHLRDEGARHDVIDAVLRPDTDNLLQAARQVEALIVFISTADGKELLQGVKRAINILEAEDKKKTAITETVEPDRFVEAEETALYKTMASATKQISTLVTKGDFSGALKTLATLHKPVDAFFEKVLVNDEDAAIRANRLALLSRIRTLSARIADFSKLAG
ncbi:MAG: Glycyl-tRNA synthetase subunit beta [Candidatus Tokpelaia hoelldobleri]|uniref:Glycine--tRNA ligase beta subunit n=1 Tax=Candidatus Tokpelaia hoelldobleri TaxID=1902579 RepID=A0A1U9JT88_9HYPH|nr:MAG: Glycyl-tRNA synthetase subunit beta [Candidatus Tokpelaia hoelldoblerii]